MADHTKISVEVPTRDLVQEIAKAEGRSMGKQIETWAKKDAKRLSIGTRIVPKPQIPKAAGLENAPTNTNEGSNVGRETR